MKNPGGTLALLAALAVPAAARAGPAIVLRGGWAPSFGEAVETVPMAETVRWQLPLQVDALWREGPLAAGAYASYGVGIAGGCDPDARCTASSWRVGAEATWTFRASHPGLEPWVGAGAGYEWTTRRSERAGAETEWAYRGVELASLQGGADFRVGRRIAVGPFALLSIGRYQRVRLDTPVEEGSREIGGKSFHGWLEIGLRGTFDLLD